MLKMNYSSLSDKTRGQVEKEAIRRGLGFNRHTETRDIIGMIIAHDAYYEGKNDVLANNASQKPAREAYRLEFEDNNYFLKLTDEQIRFFEYLSEHYINPEYASLKQIKEIEYETP